MFTDDVGGVALACPRQQQARDTVDQARKKWQDLNCMMRSLGNTGISDDACKHLARVLEDNHTLTYLDVASNAFTTLGHVTIAHGLECNDSLRYLSYSDNRMQEHAGVHLIHALQRHPTIQTALFQDCFSGSDVAAAIAAMTRNTKTLHTLDLTCMGIKSDQAAALLAKSVENNSALAFLNLSYNEITLRGCKALRDAVVRADAHIFLSLEGNSGEKR
ncbi:hypothetical protein FI667_g5782, partial [Globisporangium splendens]